jgi:hypothetical protein
MRTQRSLWLQSSIDCNAAFPCGVQGGQAHLQEVKRFENNMSRDYRLNRRLYTACEHDVPTLCPDTCDMYAGHACGGQVLRCLTENKQKIKKSACKQEVFYFVKMEVRTLTAQSVCCLQWKVQACIHVKSFSHMIPLQTLFLCRLSRPCHCAS